MPGNTPQSRTLRLRRLGAELTRRRDAAGLSREDVAERLEMAVSTLYRTETGQARPQARTIRDLLDLYGVTGSERDALVTLAREAKERGWWHAYSDVLSPQLSAYIGLESEAAELRTFELAVVPGLLQTEEYARALIRSGLLRLDPDEVERRVEVRMGRQSLLAKQARPQLWAIVDEAALRRLVGGPAVMRAQLHYLREVAEHGRAMLQVIPFSVGGHPGTPGPFIVVSFPDTADPDLVYVETVAGELYLEKPEDVARYTLVFDHLRAAALHPDESVALIATVSEEQT